jgi:hypothetical protein
MSFREFIKNLHSLPMSALIHHESNHTGATPKDGAASLGANRLGFLRYLDCPMKL